MGSKNHKRKDNFLIKVFSVKRQRVFSLDDLLAKVTPENIHKEVDFGKPVGKEIW